MRKQTFWKLSPSEKITKDRQNHSAFLLFKVLKKHVRILTGWKMTPKLFVSRFWQNKQLCNVQCTLISNFLLRVYDSITLHDNLISNMHYFALSNLSKKLGTFWYVQIQIFKKDQLWLNAWLLHSCINAFHHCTSKLHDTQFWWDYPTNFEKVYTNHTTCI